MWRKSGFVFFGMAIAISSSNVFADDPPKGAPLLVFEGGSAIRGEISKITVYSNGAIQHIEKGGPRNFPYVVPHQPLSEKELTEVQTALQKTKQADLAFILQQRWLRTNLGKKIINRNLSELYPSTLTAYPYGWIPFRGRVIRQRVPLGNKDRIDFLTDNSARSTLVSLIDSLHPVNTWTHDTGQAEQTITPQRRSNMFSRCLVRIRAIVGI